MNLPNLVQRRDIWENFPVSLTPLGKGDDAAERHAIVWNRKKLAERRNFMSSKEWVMYEKMEETKLLLALSNSNQWTVESPQDLNQICVICMTFKTYGKVSTNFPSPNMRLIPTMTRLKDIMEFFPMVIWHLIPNDGNKMYSIELSNKKLKDIKNNQGKNGQNLAVANLLLALRASTAWKLLPAENAEELCRILMN